MPDSLTSPLKIEEEEEIDIEAIRGDLENDDVFSLAF